MIVKNRINSINVFTYYHVVSRIATSIIDITSLFEEIIIIVVLVIFYFVYVFMHV